MSEASEYALEPRGDPVITLQSTPQGDVIVREHGTWVASLPKESLSSPHRLRLQDGSTLEVQTEQGALRLARDGKPLHLIGLSYYLRLAWLAMLLYGLGAGSMNIFWLMRRFGSETPVALAAVSSFALVPLALLARRGWKAALMSGVLLMVAETILAWVGMGGTFDKILPNLAGRGALLAPVLVALRRAWTRRDVLLGQLPSGLPQDR